LISSKKIKIDIDQILVYTRDHQSTAMSELQYGA